MMQSKNRQRTLPVAIDDKVYLRSPLKAAQGQGFESRILGCRWGDCLIVQYSAEMAKLSALVNTDFVCVSFHNGVAYYFKTRVLNHFPEEALVILSYPDSVRKKKIRKYPRIQVRLETFFRIQDNNFHIRELDDFKGQIFNGTTVDISRGGCRTLVRSFRKIPIDTLCSLDFMLPNDQSIEELGALVVKSEPVDEQTYEIGLRFLGPFGQIRKVALFCESAEAIQGLED